jgi:glycosyltransferase involved in cell wall biosynthesis
MKNEIREGSVVWGMNVNGEIREKAMLAVANDFGMAKHAETLTVILLSYNRPKMIAETLKSIDYADQIIIVDDGSDFDPIDIVNELGIDIPTKIIKAKPAPLEVRINQPRLGKMLNGALSQVETTLVTYICDDDIFGPGWLKISTDWMHEHPACHVIKGGVLHFINDISDARPGYIDGRGLTSGNIVHRRECAQVEGIKWLEDSLDCIDDAFFWSMHSLHNTWMIPFINQLAIYRRVHPNALSAFLNDYKIEIGDKTIKARVRGGFSEEGKKQLKEKEWME